MLIENSFEPEHLNGVQVVGGSNPLAPTKIHKVLQSYFCSPFCFAGTASGFYLLQADRCARPCSRFGRSETTSPIAGR